MYEAIRMPIWVVLMWLMDRDEELRFSQARDRIVSGAGAVCPIVGNWGDHQTNRFLG